MVNPMGEDISKIVIIGAGQAGATVAFGLLGVLASQGLGRMAAHLVLVSSGTVLAVLFERADWMAAASRQGEISPKCRCGDSREVPTWSGRSRLSA